ncbi:MAG: GNAT family N-acetyltransferase, partial [Bacillota bacterium]
MEQKEIKIRRMTASDKKRVDEIVRGSFPLAASLFFKPKPVTLVAVIENRVVGGVVLGRFSYGRNKQAGILYWLFTAPEARREGAARALVEEASNRLFAQGCQEIFACIEGYNSASASIFFSASFKRLSAWQQFMKYGYYALNIWWNSHHVFDLGHQLWVLEQEGFKEKVPRQPYLSWLVNLIVSTVIFLTALVRSDMIELSPIAGVYGLLSLALTYGLREGAGLAAAKGSDLDLEYYPWESGQTIALLIAGAFGSFLPVPGAFYPREAGWHYQEKLPELARQALASTGIVLVAAWLLKLDFFLAKNENMFLQIWQIALLNLAVFDIALPFFPFTPFNGKR